MTLIILNKSPVVNFFSKELYKIFLRKIIGKNRGPNGVTESIIRGLNELNYEYKLNPNTKEINSGDVIWVNESIEALKWAINFKKETQKLVAGPNLVIFPTDENEVLCGKNIDIILQPSAWTKDLMSSIKPELEKKIKIWPAGVFVPNKTNIIKDINVLIYTKNNSKKELLEKIKNKLKEDNKKVETIDYGTFKQKEYFDLLERSEMMIYIANSESQGLALQEAWARNIPTLVFDKEKFEHNGKTFKYEKISAPYLNEESGMFFKENDFIEKYNEFISKINSFKPKEYVINNLSDKVCTQKFLEIINNK